MIFSDSQKHFIFRKNNRTYISDGTILYRLSINTGQMNPENRTKIRSYPLLDLSMTGNAVTPRTALLTLNFLVTEDMYSLEKHMNIVYMI